MEILGVLQNPSWLLFALLASFLAILIFVRKQWNGDQRLGLPPGVPALPVIGSMPFMSIPGENNYLYFTELSKKYGPVFSFRLGRCLVVMLTGYKTIKKAFAENGAIFAGRPFDDFLGLRRTVNPDMKGIFDPSVTAEWKEDRKVSLSILRGMGLGRSTMETQILRESKALVTFLNHCQGCPTNPRDVFKTCVGNVITSIVSGKRFDYDNNAELLQFTRDSDRFLELLASLLRYEALPMTSLAMLWPPFNRGKQDFIKTHAAMVKFVKNLVGYQEGCVVNDASVNFVDEYTRRKGKAFQEDSLLFILVDLLVAGTDSTAATLCWAMIYMVNNPQIQKKIQEEIDSEVGRVRSVTGEDKVNLPYTDAALMELMRITALAPLGAPHMTLQDIELDGFKIPQGTTVFANLWSVLRDSKLWPNPDQFQPERFLDDNNNNVGVHRPEMVTFSLGPRTCLGEVLARQELFIFFTAILQHFTIVAPPGVTKLDEKGVAYTSRQALPFEVIFQQRPHV